MTDKARGLLYTATVNEAGRIVIPAPLRCALRIESGTQVTLRLCGEYIEIRPQRDLIADLQAIAKRHKTRGRRHKRQK